MIFNFSLPANLNGGDFLFFSAFTSGLFRQISGFDIEQACLGEAKRKKKEASRISQRKKDNLILLLHTCSVA